MRNPRPGAAYNPSSLVKRGVADVPEWWLSTQSRWEARVSRIRWHRIGRQIVVAALYGSLSVAGLGCGDEGGPAAPAPPTGTPNQRPTARIVLDVDVGDAPLTVRFDGSQSTDPDGQLQGFAWTFGDGATGSGVTANHTYTFPGRYTVVLTVTDDRGATASVSDSIDVSTRAGTGTNTIQGTVWYDRDGDGARAANEGGLEGFRVYLDEDGDGTRGVDEPTSVTDAVGNYSFAGVDSTRSHQVRQELTFGWTSTSPSSQPVVAPLPLTGVRVVGGTDATIEEFPFQAALIAAGQSDPALGQFCGGSLIAARWVLTAAHCVDGGTLPESVDVLLGTANLASGGERVSVIRIRIFPEYGISQGIDNDLALLELARPIMRSRIALASAGQPGIADAGVVATVVGWGLTQASGSPSTILQKGAAPILSNQECATAYSDLTDAMICTSQVGGVDACQGDSGGPLAVVGPLGWVQVGIVSFGLRCAAFPGVYARVSTLYDFVALTVPAEPSAVGLVDWAPGQRLATVDFGNFR